ncbi:hypothetical protein DRE_01173 [Drechslerella stenobrocha 248]|uniref:Major facilitator superfamily (MFS) profile domain-containing protein n=1 Tax=Drechslerella stenobrocha 248 TaxID=1043628 RepID=W7HW97_9PEZI|nr:hypothetical protein DRE_01173 [Drechslerella stenobrocha 248]
MEAKADSKQPTASERGGAIGKTDEKQLEAGVYPSTASEHSKEGGPASKETIASAGDGPGSVEAALDVADESAPPDGGYGWVCVISAMFINACTWGINSSYGVFLSYYLTHMPPLFPEATPLDYAFIGGVTAGCVMLVSPLANLLTRRFSSRVAMLLGCALQFASLIGASFSYRVWHLYLSQGVLYGLGMGFIFAASVGIIPQWFQKRRSVANGISAAGGGIGGLAFSLGSDVMLRRLGLAWTFRITGIVALVVNITCSLLLRDRNKKINPDIKMFELGLLKRIEFLYIIAWGGFSMLGYLVILFSLPNYGISVGLTMQQGSIMGAALNLGMAIGRPFVGFYSDVWGRINVAGALTFACSLTVFIIWINSSSFGALIFFGIINGAICGTFWTTVAPVAAEVVTLKELPSALNIIWLSLICPLTFSEVIGLALRQTYWDVESNTERSSYLHPQVFAGLMYLVAALSMLLLREWKIRDEDEKAGETGPEAKFGKGKKKWVRWARV